MASNQLIQLPSFSYTSLDFDTIVEDVKTLIKQHPEYNANWDDFLESNSGRMFSEVMSFIIEKLAARVDWMAQEMFITSATQRQSLINLLKLINHRPYLPKAAKVNIKGKLTKWTSPFKLPARETIIGFDTNGNATRFECIDMADDGKPNYDYQYTLQTGTDSDRTYEFLNIPFYQGTTYTEDSIFVDGISNERYTLEQYPVIENSIRVYSFESGVEFPEVDSFISKDAQQVNLSEAEKVPPYMVEIDADNKATIVFGSSSIVKIPSAGQRLKIMYRVGGGLQTNIVAGAINTTKTYALDDNSRISVIFTNPDIGFGGSDEEDIETAKLTAPISLRSANKAVTYEDYVVHLESIPSILRAHVIGKENEPDEIYAEYGYLLPPLETWIFACPQRDNYNSIDPFYFNRMLQIEKPYIQHRIFEQETITFTSSIQSVYLKKYRPYLGYALYVIPADNYTASPYSSTTDFTFNEISGSLTRIATSDGGTIPAGNTSLVVAYISDESVADFYGATVLTFGTNDKIYLSMVSNSIYPTDPIIVKKANGTEYAEGTDYSINYENNCITRITTGSISASEKVFIQYSDNWLTGNDDDSEESMILSKIADKKMICVDNILKETVYSTYDIAATVYCHKNLRSKVESSLGKHLRELYNITTAKYNTSINKSIIISDIMAVSGVKLVNITYLGRNYEAYRRYLLNTLTLDELNELNANKVEEEIYCKYNEMFIPAADHFEGSSSLIENQRSGIILTFKEM